MPWFRTSLLLLLANPAWAVEGFVLGAGVENDTGDGLAGVIVADVGFTEKTWVSGSVGVTTVDLPNGVSLNTVNTDIGIDHWFKPLGVQFEVAYWGDDDILDSVDVRASLYWRNDAVSIAADYEYRDLVLNIPRTEFFAGREIEFDAQGVGITARFDVSDAVSLNLKGINYDYNANLSLDSNRGILDLLSVSRLSLVNSLIDYRVGAGVSLDAGERSWSLDYRTWKGAADGSTTNSTTVRFLTPIGQRGDIEFGLGVDDSDSFGSVTFFSVFLFFYGAG